MRREFLPIAWTIIICILSVLPVNKDGGVSLALDVGHVFAYAVLALLWFISVRRVSIATLVSLCSTPITEIVQIFTPWREACLIDVANNAIGVILGFCCMVIVKRILWRR